MCVCVWIDREIDLIIYLIDIINQTFTKTNEHTRTHM